MPGAPLLRQIIVILRLFTVSSYIISHISPGIGFFLAQFLLQWEYFSSI